MTNEIAYAISFISMIVITYAVGIMVGVYIEMKKRRSETKKEKMFHAEHRRKK